MSTFNEQLLAKIQTTSGILIAPGDIGIDLFVDTDWDGTPKIILTETERTSEASQLNRNLLESYTSEVHVMAADRGACNHLLNQIKIIVLSSRFMPPVSYIGFAGRELNNLMGDGGTRREEFEGILTFNITEKS